MGYKRLEPVKKRIHDKMYSKHVFDAKELGKNAILTVKIKRMKQLHWRLKLSCLIMRIAAWVGWYGIEFEDRGSNG